MSHADFLLLSLFSWLYQHSGPDGRNMDFGTICLLGETEMFLPIWFPTASGWKIAGIKPFVREAVGIETGALRKMCRHLKVREAALVNTLFRFSMLSTIPGQKYYEAPKFRMPFFGDIKGFEGYAPPCDGFGFIVERRRLEGNFRWKGAP
jgi:hypothetical protein